MHLQISAYKLPLAAKVSDAEKVTARLAEGNGSLLVVL